MSVTDPDRDWPSDFADQDNGNYLHLCRECGNQFAGHKRRPNICRKCSTEGAERFASLPPDIQAASLARDADEVATLLGSGSLSPSRVVCAAMLMDDGLIVPGARHYSSEMRKVLLRIYGERYHRHVKEQGFIDQHAHFLTRQQAWAVAKAQGQVRRRCGGDDNAGGTLFSENLY